MRRIRSVSIPAASPGQLAAINAEVDALLDANDAVASRARGGVHQAAQGNFDRAAANLDACRKGGCRGARRVIHAALHDHHASRRTVHLPPASDGRCVMSP
jgi:hypothetical protein